MMNWEPLLFRSFHLGKPKGRADERTRTAHLLQLRVIFRALQGVAQACNSPISKPLSLLRLARRCTVLRS
jgi:hypothetical protein